MEESINELMCMISEKLKLNSFKIIGIDEFDIMWKSINDGYGVTYNIMSNNIEIYFDGHKYGFISKNNIDKGYNDNDNDINIEYYKEMTDLIFESIGESEEVVEEIKKMLKNQVFFQHYENAVVIKKLLDRL